MEAKIFRRGQRGPPLDYVLSQIYSLHSLVSSFFQDPFHYSHINTKISEVVSFLHVPLQNPVRNPSPPP